MPKYERNYGISIKYQLDEELGAFFLVRQGFGLVSASKNRRQISRGFQETIQIEISAFSTHYFPDTDAAPKHFPAWNHAS